MSASESLAAEAAKISYLRNRQHLELLHRNREIAIREPSANLVQAREDYDCINIRPPMSTFADEYAYHPPDDIVLLSYLGCSNYRTRSWRANRLARVAEFRDLLAALRTATAEAIKLGYSEDAAAAEIKTCAM